MRENRLKCKVLLGSSKREKLFRFFFVCVCGGGGDAPFFVLDVTQNNPNMTSYFCERITESSFSVSPTLLLILPSCDAGFALDITCEYR